MRGFPINTYRCFCVCAVSGVELVAGGGAGSGTGTVGCCWTGTTCAVLPCKNALPRGSPETVKTGVALQLESKTGALVVAAVGVVVVFGARFVAGAGAGIAITGVLFLLLGQVEEQEQ